MDPNAKKRVVLANDTPLLVQALTQILTDAKDFEIVGIASTGAQVGPLVSRTDPDLVLLDLYLPVLDGLSCLALLRERHTATKVVIFSGTHDPSAIERALSAGAAAFVAESIDPSDLPSVLRQALAGNVYYRTPLVSEEALRLRHREDEQQRVLEQTGLTERELEVLGAVSGGLSNRAVGKQLFLSDNTVKFHLHNIYGKLGVANRTEATGIAHRLGVVRRVAVASV